MDDRAALVRAALRYCIYASQDVRDRIYSGRSFTDVYARDPYNDPGWRALSARLASLIDMQAAVESLHDEASLTPDSLRARLVELGCTTPHVWRVGVPTEQEERAIAEERERFCSYIQQLTADDLQRDSMVYVPSERELTQRERNRIWARLRRRWGVERNSTWYPLIPYPTPPPPHILAFQADWFAWDVPLSALRGVLKSRRVRRVWQLRNTRPDDAKELDVALIIPEGYETFWTSDKMDWLIYSSHESSLTIGGEWLLNAVKQAWPAWSEHLYEAWEHIRPPFGEGLVGS
jgi:hypothetical protein